MRRTAVFVILVLTVLSGCITANAPSSNPEYDSYVFDHAGIDEPIIEGGIEYPKDDKTETRRYVTLVTTEGGKERFNFDMLDQQAKNFINATNFDRSYIVVIQEFPASSSPDYRVEDVTRQDRDLDISINDSSMGGTADITVETVLVRVKEDQPPKNIRVTTEDGDTFTGV